MSNLMDLDKQYVANTYKRFPLCIVRGKGSEAFDENGKRYIDLGSGIAVTSFGMADEEWQQAVIAQLNKVQHTSNLYYTEPCVKLAQMLCERTGMKKIFFGNSGAEANEGAIKAARKYAAEKKGSDYYTIITLENSFHGRTLTTLAATGQDAFHKLYQPLTPGFVHCPANDLEAMKVLVKAHKTAGILIECIQGEGGVKALEPGFVKGLRELCDQEDIVLMVDEVQSGNGRSGYLYSYMAYGIMPDVVTTAKSLGGGLPIGAVMLGEKVENVFGYGDHGSTFGGNPTVCAGAVNLLGRIDDKLLAEVRAKSEYLFKELGSAEGVTGMDGMGLMIGISTVKPCGDVVAKCLENGVMCLTAHGKVRLLPALNIPMELLQEAAAVIKEACKP